MLDRLAGRLQYGPPVNETAARDRRRELMGNYSVVVLDFETTGLSPDSGDRTIEVGAVLVQENRIRDRFQSLMNPGVRVSGFIEEYTGITNKMLSSAPPAAQVMRQFAAFMS